VKSLLQPRTTLIVFGFLASCCTSHRATPNPRIPDLIRELQSDDAERQSNAQRELLAFQAEAVGPLLWSFEHGRVGERIFGRNTLLKMKEATPTFPPVLESKDVPVPPYPLEAETLVKIGEAAVPALLEAVPGTEEPQRSAILDVLYRIGQPAAPGLARLANGGSAEVQLDAVKTLGKMGLRARSAFPDLVTLLRSSPPVLQCALIDALLQIDPSSPTLRDSLVVLEQYSPDAGVKNAATRALERK